MQHLTPVCSQCRLTPPTKFMQMMSHCMRLFVIYNRSVYNLSHCLVQMGSGEATRLPYSKLGKPTIRRSSKGGASDVWLGEGVRQGEQGTLVVEARHSCSLWPLASEGTAVNHEGQVVTLHNCSPVRTYGCSHAISCLVACRDGFIIFLIFVFSPCTFEGEFIESLAATS